MILDYHRIGLSQLSGAVRAKANILRRTSISHSSLFRRDDEKRDETAEKEIFCKKVLSLRRKV